MTKRYSPLLTLSAGALIMACGGNPPATTPEPETAPAPAVTAPSAASDARKSAAQGHELSDERAKEIARGYVELLKAGNYEQMWEHVTPAAKERFGSFEDFRGEGERIMSDLGTEIGIVSETIEPARAGMLANKLYFRVSHYAGADGRPVRLLIGLKNDGSIAGIQVREAQ